MKKKKITWRLSKLPAPDELRELVKDKIITQEEARGVLFKEVEEIEGDRDVKSFESEIKFLRELVEKLSKGNTQIIETIRTIEVPYIRDRWYQPYCHWSGGTSNITIATGSGTVEYAGSGSGSSIMYANTAESGGSFSNIETF